MASSRYVYRLPYKYSLSLHHQFTITNTKSQELYEPLWEDLIHLLGQKGLKVRGIWIADVAWQGHSAVLNEANLGNDPSWFDHARDLLHMINHFRREMPRPLVGVGHSFGGNIMVNLALLHPRLLSTLVLLDPTLSRFKQKGPKYGFMPMVSTSRRRDLWPSRAEAAASFNRNPFYKTWDPRVLELWNKYGLRDAPTSLYPDAKNGEVTLTTTKHQECFTYYRPQAQAYDPKTGKPVLDRSILRDLPDDFARFPDFLFYRAEGTVTTEKLPELRPGVLWLFGETSAVNPPEAADEKLELTGVGWGGSGGVKAGRVAAVTIPKFGHLVPMEATTRCAQEAADWIAKDLRHWREEEAEFQNRWLKKTDAEKQVMDEDFKRWIVESGGVPPEKKKKPASKI